MVLWLFGFDEGGFFVIMSCFSLWRLAGLFSLVDCILSMLGVVFVSNFGLFWRLGIGLVGVYPSRGCCVCIILCVFGCVWCLG